MKPSHHFRSRVVLPILPLILLLALGDTSVNVITVLAPFAADSVSYDAGKLFIVSVAKEAGENLLVSTQWKIEKEIDLSSKDLKEAFPKTFVKLFPPSSTIQSVKFLRRQFRGYFRPDSLGYRYADTATVAALWAEPAFTGMVKDLQAVEVLSVIVTMTGWKDTTLVPVYDDPSADNRALYKIPVRFIPGANDVHFAPAGRKESAAAFATRFVHESVPPADRSERFHNSELEAGCASCHEGLPSSSEGAAMTADCAACHKEHVPADFVHGPVEMKECATCHSWSAEKKAVVVEQGVPATCGTCHAEQAESAASAAVPHAVAGECVTCHTPHSSDRKHLLKDDVNALCAGCHEGFEINHPVGRHPVRFKTVAATGEELSCASCHDPHGSPHPKLLKAAGTSAEICAQCH